MSAIVKTIRQKLSLHDPLKVDRLPPHSIEAEQGVLGCAMLHANDVLTELVNAGVEAEWFYDLRHQEIIDAMFYLFNRKQPVDLITLQQVLKDSNRLEGCGGLSYLSSLPDAVPSAANLSYYAEIVEEKYVLRKTIQTCTDIVSKAYDHDGDTDGFLERVEKSALALRTKKQTAGFVDVSKTLDMIVERVARVTDTQKPVGMETGFKRLDDITGGMDGSQLWIFSGERSVGKTSITFNIALNRVFSFGDTVGIVSLETSGLSVLSRMICTRWQIDSRKLRCNPTDEELKRLSPAIAEFRKIKDKLLICEDSGMTPSRIRAVCRRMAQNGAKLFIVDYVQLVHTTDKKKNATERVGDAVYALKDLAKELSAPVLTISALSRDGQLRSSGEIDYAADVIVKLKKPDNAEDDDKVWKIQARVEKGKDSGGGRFTLDFVRPYFRYENEAVGDYEA